jgi:adenine-specific DNA-methyltransferase
MDEVFNSKSYISQIAFLKTTSSSSGGLSSVFDYVLWYAKGDSPKIRPLFQVKVAGAEGASQYSFGENEWGERKSLKEWSALADSNVKVFAHDNITSQRPAQGEDVREFSYEGKRFTTGKGTFKTDMTGLNRLAAAKRMMFVGNTLRYVRFLNDFAVFPYSNFWDDTVISGFADPKVYVVQTSPRIIERCILMATDPTSYSTRPVVRAPLPM